MKNKHAKKTLADCVNEAIDETISEAMDEGIDFDEHSLEVSFNPSHEENVDTSVENNPTFSDEYGKGIRVFSVFKRKKNYVGTDGNPLLYALKGENGWHFKSGYDRRMVERQIHAIVEKFSIQYPVGLTIVMPSGSRLNDYFADVIKSKNRGANIIKGVIRKERADEIEREILLPNSAFRTAYPDRDVFLRKLNEFRSYKRRMNSERGGYFTYHFIPDQKMRNAIENTLKLNDDDVGYYSEVINEHDVLIIDDSINSGQTIKDACKQIITGYTPKSITVLTLFSKLYK